MASDISREAVLKLKRIPGINIIIASGDYYIFNENGIRRTKEIATTLSDGTVIIPDGILEGSLSGYEIAAHEAFHALDITKKYAVSEYRAAIELVIDRSHKKYQSAKEVI